MESLEKRFAHLLQPIRELTKNWEVDVALELNDYLDELDEMCITFDEGKTRLNFAEAALLIQGSTCIYSKKVELLHSLVYQTLEYINDKNKRKNKPAAESAENNEDGAASNHNEDDAGFTCLDITPSNHSENNDSFTTVNDIPLPPESLIPQETRAKQKLPLIGLKGEIVCSQRDFRLNTLNPENNVILLTSSESMALMEYDQYPAVDIGVEQAEQNDRVQVDAANVGVDAAEDNFLPLDDNGLEMEHEAQEHIDRHQAPSEGIVIRERRQVVEAHKPREEEFPTTVNVWAVHDPYATLEEDKPFKSGKCYKVPDGLDEGGKRKRKKPSLQDFGTWFKGNFDPPPHKLKTGPTFIELNYIYLGILEDKLKTKKRIYRNAGLLISDEELRQTLLQPAESEEQRQGEEPLGGVNHPGIIGEDEDNSDNEQEEFPEDIPAEFGGGPDFLSPEDQTDELSYEQLVKLRVEQLVVNSMAYTQETALSRRVKDWEDKIRPELSLQEERPTFDIHDYGDRIVNAFNHVGERRSFSSLVCGLDNFDACKYLLASLQLANDYTVEIDSLDGLEKSLDSMGLTLRSVDRATERFKNLQASS